VVRVHLSHSLSVCLSVSLVPFEMEGEMVGAGEAPITVGAFEGFGSGVLPVVAGQLVGARKPPLTASPGTSVRLLTCNTPENKDILNNIVMDGIMGPIIEISHPLDEI
jgi:hypothetical protein